MSSAKHRYILKNCGVNLKGKIVHHIDGNHYNNLLTNFQIVDSDAKHNMFHYVMNHDRELYDFIMFGDFIQMVKNARR